MEAMLRHYTMHEMLHGHHHDSTCVGNMRRNDEYRTHHRSPHHSGGSHHHSAHRSRSVFLRHMTEEGEGCSPSLVKVRRQYLLSRPPGHTMKKLQDMTLCMQMMDYDRFTRDDPIGEILLPLKSVKFDNCPVYWKNLQKPTVHKEPKGELMLSLCYLPQSNKVTCVVVKAKDLPPKDVTGFADPYVKLWLLQEGTKIEKKKTTVKSQTLTPIYNESFAFAISPDKMEDIQLVASVMDYDLIKSNDDIGFVVLGTKGSETGKKHWQEMMSRPGYPIGMWHPLQPKW